MEGQWRCQKDEPISTIPPRDRHTKGKGIKCIARSIGFYRLMPGFHHSVAVRPLPLAIAVSVHRCRCRCRCRCVYLFAVYGCNGTEFSYVIFTEQRNFTTAERRNGNGRTATEWWKPGISHWGDSLKFGGQATLAPLWHRQRYTAVFRSNSESILLWSDVRSSGSSDGFYVRFPRGNRSRVYVGGVTPPETLNEHSSRNTTPYYVLLPLLLLDLQSEAGPENSLPIQTTSASVSRSVGHKHFYF